MQSLLFATFLSLLLSTISAQDDDPSTPAWITPTISLPSPYTYPSIYVTTDSAGSCQASLELYSPLRCRNQATVYPSTTTLDFPIDCLGCSSLEVSTHVWGCPLGTHYTSYPDTTVNTPRTRVEFVCSPTPAPTAR